MAVDTHANVVRALNEAYNARDLDAAIALTTPEVEFVNVATGETFRGPDGVRQFMQGWATAFPDSQVETTRVLADEQGAAMEFTGRGTHTGSLQTPGGAIAPTGQPVEVRFCQVFELHQGKITGARLYFDVNTMLHQLGVMPQPGQAAAAGMGSQPLGHVKETVGNALDQAKSTVVGVLDTVMAKLGDVTHLTSAMDAHKAHVRRFYDEVWNHGRLEVVDELNAPTYIERTPAPGLPATSEGVKHLVAMYRAAFPDTQFTVDEVLAEGDRVVVRWTARGTHQHELQGIPATYKQVTVTGMDLYRLENGKLVEHWGNWDQLGLLQQLGAIPAPEQAAREATA